MVKKTMLQKTMGKSAEDQGNPRRIMNRYKSIISWSVEDQSFIARRRNFRFAGA